MLTKGKITVDDNGVEIAYTDSGPPPNSDSYTTIFAVHGMAFRAGIFEKLQAIAGASNVRVVAVTRRNYVGSTPYSEDELRIINNGGSEEEKTAFVTNYGVELINFVDRFILEKGVPTQGEKDGIALVGWSLGTTVVLSAAANMRAAKPEVRERIAPLMAIIFHDASNNMYGIPHDERNWFPINLVDSTITPANELPFFAFWVSSYFQHGDLSLRSRDVLQFQVPGITLRPPTVYSISSTLTAQGRDSEVEVLDYTQSPKTDMFYQFWFFAQLKEVYEGMFDKGVREEIPNAKVYHLGAEYGPAFSPLTTWLVKEEDERRGGGWVKAEIVSGQNHFAIWDDPEDTLKIYLDCVAGTF